MKLLYESFDRDFNVFKATWKEVQNITAVDESHNSSAGDSIDFTEVFIILKNGEKKSLPVADRQTFGSQQIADRKEEPVSVGEFLAWENIAPTEVAKIEVRHVYRNDDYEEEITNVYLLNVTAEDIERMRKKIINEIKNASIPDFIGMLAKLSEI